jgi:multidrug efflux pump subunit AcrA (membrane-fusion protein)
MTGKFAATAIVLIAAFTLALGGCRSSNGGGDSEDVSVVQPPSAVTMAVSGAKVTVVPMRRELHLLGTTVAYQRIQLRAPSAGRVLDYQLRDGARVRRGEVVAHILNREVEAAANGLAVARRLDPAEAPALARSVRRYSHGGGVAVVARDDGIVEHALVSDGQLVNEMDPLADLIDPDSVYVEAEVPINDVAAIRPGMEAAVTSPMVSGATLPARVAALSPKLSPNGATTPVRIQFTTARRITQTGAPVEVTVTTAEVPDALAIPAAALFEDARDNRNYVFVVGADGRAHRTSITTGIRSGDLLQAKSGLRDGEVVITSGGYAVSDGLKVKVTVAPR